MGPIGSLSQRAASTTKTDFRLFVLEVEPQLRRALIGAIGVDETQDAVAEALLYAWQNWSRVKKMASPIGYLYKVGRSHARVRTPKRVRFLVDEPALLPDVEPDLLPALRSLSEQQRTAVWLVHACGWSYQETADALDISRSAVGTHLVRGLEHLRNRLGVTDHV